MNARFLSLTLAISAATGFAVSLTAPSLSAAKAPPPAAPPAVTAPAAGGAAEKAVPLTKEQTSFFEGKIRPLLSASCYKCHSVESGKNRGGLVLDTKDGWVKGGDTGTAIVPGDPDKSLLIKAISYKDPDVQMPPKGEKLTDQQIADLTTWVKMGAPDPRVTSGGPKLTGLNDKARSHWAYQPIKKSEVPAVQIPAWVRTPVDAFVLAKLAQNGMQPSGPAAKETLLRRAYYDLTGLPPTPQDIRAFQADSSPTAFEKVVDKLLASPAYGERWGRFWLDSARYSDTTGGDNKREEYRFPYAWTYRDYVIKAFNDDKPYDQFLKEQIAADLLPESKKDPSCLAALGFITVGKRFANPNDQIDERIDALSKATMALTVACARCHDHKFDPIPTQDYYSLHGIFASTAEPAEKPIIGPAPKGPEYDDFKKQLAFLEEKNKEIYFDLVASKSNEFRSKAAGYLLVQALGRKATNKDALKMRYDLQAEFKLDRDLLNGGYRGKGQDTVLTPFQMFAQLDAENFAEKAKDILKEVTSGTSKRRPINPVVVKAFSEVKPEQLKSIRNVAEVYGKLFASIDKDAKAYMEACRKATTEEVKGYDPHMVELFNIPAQIESACVLSTDKLREIAPKLPVANQGAYSKFKLGEINELMLTHPGAPARAMVVGDSYNARDSYVFVRGEAQNRGPLAPRRFLEIIAGKDRPTFKNGSGRLELAEAIANKSNPLTARVLVNRVWMHHFGRGIVPTLDDMGVQSEPPSHPEMLDYLAATFMENGWSIKKLHRTIMLSSTYQQNSDTNLTYASRDPDNKLLWRQNLRRLDFEAVRDTMLTFTGKMDHSVGGKPVNLTDEPYSFRRSVYGYIDRGQMPELMAQFDFPDADMANSKRASTIVPQQALFFMNSPMAVDVARKVTSRPEFVAAKDDAAKVKVIYEVLFARAPRPEEVKLAAGFLAGARSDDETTNGTLASASEKGSKAGKQAGVVKVPKGVIPAKKGGDSRKAIQNSGEYVERKPLNPWEQYTQALLFTNEIAYVN